MDKPATDTIQSVKPFLRQFGYFQLLQMRSHYQLLLKRDGFAHMKEYWTKGLEIINEVINEILSTSDQEAGDRPPDMD